MVTSTDTVNDHGGAESTQSSYDRKAELKAFDDTKAGVKGLVDAGVTKIPRIFIYPTHDSNKNSNSEYSLKPDQTIPIIDLEYVQENPNLRTKVIEKVLDSCEKWGFFQVVNHGIPISVLDEMVEGVRRFNDQDTEVKKMFYTRDNTKKVAYVSNPDLYLSQAAGWRDSLAYDMAPHPPHPQELPVVCRDIVIDYTKQVMRLGCTLLELISESLGLNPKYLEDMDCAKGLIVFGHYYPPCPEPELTMGGGKHTDGDFFTILLQDHIGGLQVLHENNQWVDVTPIRGALLVNIGDLMQLISNDKLKSVYHRVLAKHIGPRISVASLFRPQPNTEYALRPIKDLISEEHPPIYRETTNKDFAAHLFSKPFDDDVPSLLHFKL